MTKTQLIDECIRLLRRCICNDDEIDKITKNLNKLKDCAPEERSNTELTYD